MNDIFLAFREALLVYHELAAAFFATLFFSMLFCCPRKFLFLSGLNGFVAWFTYLFVYKYTSSLVFANFWATSAVVMFSQVISLRRRVPLDVFLVPGIFVLVPGATIYKMFFAFITHVDKTAFLLFKETVSIGFSIAMAIFVFVFIFETLNKTFINRMQDNKRPCPVPAESAFTTAVDIGRMMLESGSETHKVEETIDTFCRVNGLLKIQSFVIPTGIIATLLERKNRPLTELVRISKRSLNLGKLSAIMEALTNYYMQKIYYSDLISRLAEVKKLVFYKKHEQYLSAAFAVACFSTLFAGGPGEFYASFVIGLLAQIMVERLSNLEFPAQLINLLVSAFICLGANMAVKYLCACSADILIISSIMILVPGVTIINALREIIAGDLVSGSARGFDALIVAASIASGVGVMLTIIS